MCEVRHAQCLIVCSYSGFMLWKVRLIMSDFPLIHFFLSLSKAGFAVYNFWPKCEELFGCDLRSAVLEHVLRHAHGIDDGRSATVTRDGQQRRSGCVRKYLKF